MILFMYLSLNVAFFLLLFRFNYVGLYIVMITKTIKTVSKVSEILRTVSSMQILCSHKEHYFV